jgi:hypothetical protein
MKLLMSFVCAAVLVSAADLKLGKPLSGQEPLTVTKLMANPDSYVGKTVQVKGKIDSVCQEMGCWMELSEGSAKIRVKVEDGVIVFPKDGAGRMAIAEGKLSKTELTREQALEKAKHEAEEGNKKFDPASVKAGTSYQLDGLGAVILEK